MKHYLLAFALICFGSSASAGGGAFTAPASAGETNTYTSSKTFTAGVLANGGQFIVNSGLPASVSTMSIEGGVDIGGSLLLGATFFPNLQSVAPNSLLGIIKRTSTSGSSNGIFLYNPWTEGATTNLLRGFIWEGGSLGAPTATGTSGRKVGLNMNIGGFDGTSFRGDQGGIRLSVPASPWTVGSNPTDIEFRTTGEGSSTVGTRMFISSGGLVGIGTTIPYGKLSVMTSNNDGHVTMNDAPGSSARLILQSYNGGASQIQLYGGGYIAGHTEDQSTDLWIMATESPAGQSFQGTNLNDSYFASLASGKSFHIGIGGDNTLAAGLTVANSRKVGISTPTPNAQLDVNGDAMFGTGATKSTFSVTGALALAGSLTVSSGTAIRNIIMGATTGDCPQVALATVGICSVAATGVNAGDNCSVQADALTENLAISISSASANVVSFRLSNPSIGNIDPSSMSFRWWCIRP